jgi:oxygen-independent coproporphyrinogen-3 oxidase
MSTDGCNPAQQAGRSGRPKIAHAKCSVSCAQRTPAGLPSGIPGIGLEMEGAMQQAPQPGRQAVGTAAGSDTWRRAFRTRRSRGP